MMVQLHAITSKAGVIYVSTCVDGIGLSLQDVKSVQHCLLPEDNEIVFVIARSSDSLEAISIAPSSSPVSTDATAKPNWLTLKHKIPEGTTYKIRVLNGRIAFVDGHGLIEYEPRTDGDSSTIAIWCYVDTVNRRAYMTADKQWLIDVFGEGGLISFNEYRDVETPHCSQAEFDLNVYANWDTLKFITYADDFDIEYAELDKDTMYICGFKHIYVESCCPDDIVVVFTNAINKCAVEIYRNFEPESEDMSVGFLKRYLSRH